MIGVIFTFGTEVIEVRIDGKNLSFRNSAYGSQFASFEGIKLNQIGVEKEFPDLVGDEAWKEKATQRFKDKINSFSSEEEIATYIIEDLRNFGYIPKYKQKNGFRVEKIK